MTVLLNVVAIGGAEIEDFGGGELHVWDYTRSIILDDSARAGAMADILDGRAGSYLYGELWKFEVDR